MKTLLELCKEIIYKKCNLEVDPMQSWLNCGYRCIPFKFYQELRANEFWYCTCKPKNFIVTKNGKNYKIAGRPENCFYCWFSFLIEIKIRIIF